MGAGFGMVDRPGIRRRPAAASLAWARRLPLGLLPFLLVAEGLGATPACPVLREQRDQLATRAMRAEIALVQTIRRRLCPREEALAEQAHASGTAAPLDFGAYIRCRQQAEGLLGRTHPVLYTNRQQFVFYSAEGARLARAADGLLPQLNAACPSPMAGPAP